MGLPLSLHAILMGGQRCTTHGVYYTIHAGLRFVRVPLPFTQVVDRHSGMFFGGRSTSPFLALEDWKGSTPTGHYASRLLKQIAERCRLMMMVFRVHTDISHDRR